MSCDVTTYKTCYIQNTNNEIFERINRFIILRTFLYYNNLQNRGQDARLFFIFHIQYKLFKYSLIFLISVISSKIGPVATVEYQFVWPH